MVKAPKNRIGEQLFNFTMKLKISLAGAAIFLLVASRVFAAIPPAEALLPADTLLVFSVPDCSAMRTSAQQSPQWMLWNDPAMKPFRQDFTAKWDQKFIGPLEHNLGIRIADYLPLLQGQLTFAIIKNGWGEKPKAAPAMVLLLDAGDKADLLAKNLAALKREHGVEEILPVSSKTEAGVKGLWQRLMTTAE